MKPKHTPGPWKVQFREFTGQYHINFNGKNQSMDNDDFNANAALIAAAPEMFEALESLNYRLTELNSDGKLNGLNLNILIRAAFDVLEKARGE